MQFSEETIYSFHQRVSGESMTHHSQTKTKTKGNLDFGQNQEGSLLMPF